MRSKQNIENESEISVMIVDDEQNILNALKRLFADEPYKVYLFDSVDDALKSLEEIKYNVVISDFTMPIMSGSDFLHIVEDKYPHTIRILLTGASTAVNVPKEIEKEILHCHCFVAKPWEDDKFLQLISSFICVNKVS